jgi:hypothetical protein
VWWPASLANMRFDLVGTPFHGDFDQGVIAYEREPANSPVCLDFTDAGTFTGPLTSNGRLDTTYCLDGVAAGFSLTG